MKRQYLKLITGLVAAAGVFSCSPAPQNSMPDIARGGTGYEKSRDTAAAESAMTSPSKVAKEERPGLATGWGQRKESWISSRSFSRASSKPAGTDAIYYNNREGIAAMSGSLQRVGGLQRAAGDLVEWGVKGGSGFLPTYKDGGYGRRLVAGDKGGNYSIIVKNRSKSALEIVASVDGLDVFDGKSASFSKSGYIVDPGDTLEIAGFRTGYDAVAAFQFSSVANSYANLRHGDTRNVGVIGIAVFTQKGVNPWTWMPDEVGRREKAKPFAEAPR